MNKVLRIAKTELQTMFYSPVAWLILVVFAFQSGFLISDNFLEIARKKTLDYPIWPLSSYLFSFQELKSSLYFYLPLLTMGVISREYSSGSIKLLYSSPISDLQVVLGKYLAMVAFCAVLLMLLIPYIVIGGVLVHNFHWLEAFSPLLGLFLLVCTYAAIGLFTSSLTSYQVVAAMCTLAVLAALNYVGLVAQDVPFVRDLTYWLWLSGKADSFIDGLISSQDLLYFFIVILLFLAFTVIRFQTIKRSIPLFGKVSRYLAVLLLAVFIGYLSSRPKLISYYDVTNTKSNTLSLGSQEIMRNVRGGLTITTYVNLFDKSFGDAAPSAINNDKRRFVDYIRFKPEIKMKYVYYYRRPEVKIMTAEELKAEKKEAKKICETTGMDFGLFLSPDEIDKVIDLSSEKYRLTRLIQRESGEHTFLRVFDDMQHYPTEREITAAFKRVTMKLPKIGYIQGFGQRGLDDYSDRGYADLMSNPSSRYAMINQGVDVTMIDLKKGTAIPDEISVVVIADGNVPFDKVAHEIFTKFVQRGGNLIILGDVNHQAVLNPLIQQFGVHFLSGELVQKQTVELPNLIFAKRTANANKISYIYESFKYGDVKVALPGAVAIAQESDKGFQFLPLFVTDSIGSWNELDTRNFIDDKPVIDNAGESEQSNTVVALLQRKIGTDVQKVFIIGDADCLSNIGMSKKYRGLYTAKEDLLGGMMDYISHGKVPINIERPRNTDVDININMKVSSVIKIFAMYVIPALLLLGSTILLIRRRRK